MLGKKHPIPIKLNFLTRNSQFLHAVESLLTDFDFYNAQKQTFLGSSGSCFCDDYSHCSSETIEFVV